MTRELFQAIKSKLSGLDGTEKRQMMEGLRYGFNLAMMASRNSKGALSDEPIVREFFDWLDAQ